MSDQVDSVEQVSEADVSPRASSVGEQLRAAREANRLAVIEIAQALKLGARQVEALENGDWQGLPGPTFIRGFVRNYARLVNLDSAPLMTQLDGLLRKPVDTLAIPETRPTHRTHINASVSRRDRAVILLGIGLVAVAALVYFLLPNDLSAWRESAQGLLNSLARQDEPQPEAAPAVEPVFPPGATPQQIMNPQAVEPPAVVEAAAPVTAPVAAPVVPAPKNDTRPVVSGAPQMLFIFDKESWLEVRDRDDFVVFSQRVAAGTEHTLAGKGPLSVVVGYAPGVRVFWRGQPVDLAPHANGDVARFVLE